MPAEVCTGECRVEIVAPGWDVECFAESESYALASLYDQAEMYAQGNLFANGTQRPNSTYHGPQIEQTVYQAEVVYNFTRSASERLASAAAAQVRPDVTFSLGDYAD